MEVELIEALDMIQRLEANNLGLKNTLGTNDKCWQEKFNTLRR